MLARTVGLETLDGLAVQDPQALRARRDLRRVNRIMGSAWILIRALRAAVAPGSGNPPRSPQRPLRILELGAGDGSLMLRIAQHRASWLPPATPAVHLALLDRQALIDEATRTAFARVGWSVQQLVIDVLEWAAAPASTDAADVADATDATWRFDIIVANLFLHHFEAAALRALLAAAAARCDGFIACEPRRSALGLIGAHLIRATGASALTRHDAVLSVQAGFRDGELSALWPDGRWQLQEHAAGLFSHFFSAGSCAMTSGATTSG